MCAPLQITVGLAEVELLRSVEGDDAVSAPLARFQIGGLWLTYRTTYGGEMFLSLSLPKVCIISFLAVMLTAAV